MDKQTNKQTGRQAGRLTGRRTSNPNKTNMLRNIYTDEPRVRHRQIKKEFKSITRRKNKKIRRGRVS